MIVLPNVSENEAVLVVSAGTIMARRSPAITGFEKFPQVIVDVVLLQKTYCRTPTLLSGDPIGPISAVPAGALANVGARLTNGLAGEPGTTVL